MTTPDEFLPLLRRVVAAATIAASRHPRCGAFADLNNALRSLPPQLRVGEVPIPAHEEDDREDARAEYARLARENAVLRRRLAEVTGEVQPTLLDMLAAGGDTP